MVSYELGIVCKIITCFEETLCTLLEPVELTVGLEDTEKSGDNDIIYLTSVKVGQPWTTDLRPRGIHFYFYKIVTWKDVKGLTVPHLLQACILSCWMSGYILVFSSLSGEMVNELKAQDQQSKADATE